MKTRMAGKSHITHAKRKEHPRLSVTVHHQDLNKNIVQSIMDKTWSSRHEQPIVKPGVHPHKP